MEPNYDGALGAEMDKMLATPLTAVKQVEARSVYVVGQARWTTLGNARLARDFWASRGETYPIIKRTITEEEVE